MAKTTTKKFKRAAMISASIVLTTTIVISLGFLSFVGIYTLIPIIALAFASLILATIIEFMVIYQNIANVIKKMTKANYLKKLLAQKYLHQFIKAMQKKTDFVKELLAQKKYVHAQGHRSLAPDQREKLQAEKSRLKKIMKSFRFYLFGTGPVSDEMRKQFDKFVSKDKVASIQKEESRKKWLGRIMFLPIAVASISCGVVTYSAIVDGLSAMMPAVNSVLSTGLSIASISPAIIAVSAIAGLAYCFLIYNAALDMIYNDSLQKLFRRITKNVKKGGVKSVFYALGVLLLIGLGVFVTLATAGTWWRGVDSALSSLASSKAPVTILNIFSVVFFAVANLTFNLENTNNTLGSFEKFSIKNTFKRVKAKISKTFAKENRWQMLNPFRILLFIIKTPFRVIGFLLHILSIGATTDNFGNKWVSFAASSITEGFEDYDYIIGHMHSGGHDHHGGHNHNHADVIGWVFIAITFIPFYLPSILWDWAFGKMNKEGSDMVKPLTFGEAWRKGFGIKPKDKQLAKKDFKLSEIWYREVQYMKKNKESYQEFLKMKKQKNADSQKAPEDKPESVTPKQAVSEKTVKGIPLDSILPAQSSLSFFMQKSLPLSSRRGFNRKSVMSSRPLHQENSGLAIDIRS